MAATTLVKWTIGVTGDGVDFSAALATGDDDLAPTVVDADADIGEAAPEDQLRDGAFDVLFDGAALSWDGAPDSQLDRYIRDTVQQATFFSRSQDLGLSSGDLTNLFTEVEIAEVRTDGEDADDDGVRFATAGIAGLAMFMLLQVWGAFIMMGVMKRSRRRWSRSCFRTCGPLRCWPASCSASASWHWRRC